jgi:ribosomal subunit interface protein
LLFTISGKHVTIPESVRKHAENKTAKLTRIYSGINKIEVIIDAGKNGAVSTEIIARGEHGHVFVATEIGPDVYLCIDSAVHKLEQQLRRKKNKERDDKH